MAFRWGVALVLGVWAARGMRHQADDPHKNASQESFVLGPGAKLGSFTLLGPYAPGQSLIQLSEAETSQSSERTWPSNMMTATDLWILQAKYGDDASFAGEGSFGEVWTAVDDRSQQRVAVKIFYIDDRYKRDEYGVLQRLSDSEPMSNPEEEETRRRYLTWISATPTEKDLLRGSAAECRLQRAILGQRMRDMAGAAHVMGCLEEHIMENALTDRINYIVMPHAGQSLKTFLEKYKTSFLDHAVIKSIMVQLLLAVRFLGRIKPHPIIHHDIKPANIAIDDSNIMDVRAVLIDFGGALEATEERRLSDAVTTMMYAPPEAGRDDYAFARPDHSWDIFQLGVVFLQLVCRPVDAMDLYLQWDLLRRDFYHAINVMFTKSGMVCTFSDAFTAEAIHFIAEMMDSDPMIRPDPKTLLESEFLAEEYEKHKQDSLNELEMAAAGSQLSVPDALEEVRGHVTNMFNKGKHRFEVKKRKGHEVKCCCKSGRCKLVWAKKVLTAKEAICKYIPFKKTNKITSCECLVGPEWKSYWRTGDKKCNVEPDADLFLD